ncbi:hypothetical protein [Actinoallomurus oryzae]|uniref:hypothetical protein n=1 Tax=Actinoallomurus oryzae TaxID=502180 RepID=UPI0031E8DA50
MIASRSTPIIAWCIRSIGSKTGLLPHVPQTEVVYVPDVPGELAAFAAAARS